MANFKDVLIVVPTYNEADNVPLVIEEINRNCEGASVLFVDDNSPDGTASIVKKFIEDGYENVFLLERHRKEGIGPAYISGFKWALQNIKYARIIFECDADLSHPFDCIPAMVEEIRNGVDVVVGSRYVKGGKIEGWTLFRKILSMGASFYVNIWLRLNVFDPTSGFVAYRREVLETLPLSSISSKGYMFQIEMKYVVKKYGFKIKEVPIVFKERKYGRSKMSLAIFHEALINVPLLNFRKISRNETRNK